MTEPNQPDETAKPAPEVRPLKNRQPAFPMAPTHAGGEYFSGYDGMTLRDYFATRAPVEPAPWFTGILSVPVAPKRTAYKLRLDWRAKYDKRGWIDEDDGFIYTDSGLTEAERAEADEINRIHAAENVAYAEWSQARAIAKTAQWPWAWADAVLAARGD
jgi:hypothetical protein